MAAIQDRATFPIGGMTNCGSSPRKGGGQISSGTPFCRINAAFHLATERRIYAAAKNSVVRPPCKEIQLVSNSGYGSPIAIDIFDGFGSHGSQFVFEQVVIRGNMIRHVDNASDPTQRPLGITVDWCRNAIVENNDVNLDTTTPIQYFTVGAIKYLNNQAASGRLIQGYGFIVAQYVSELTTDAELAASLST